VRASGVANLCLIPESPFDLYGDGGFLSALERRLNNRHHAVVVVSEGAGQDLVASDNAATDKDASGNVKYKDIGLFLKDKITQYLTERGMTFTLKYIDPSYIIRSAPADTIDAEYCLLLGLFAVHSGMAGHTGVCVSKWKDHFVNVPIKVMVKERKVVDTNNEMWQSVLDITGQPARMKN
jgi:6-phosphofructokinase 1